MDFEQLLPTIQEYSIQYGLALLKAILIFVMGKFAAGIIANIIDKVMKLQHVDVAHRDLAIELLTRTAIIYC